MGVVVGFSLIGEVKLPSQSLFGRAIASMAPEELFSFEMLGDTSTHVEKTVLDRN